MHERNDEEQLEHSENENPVQSLKTVAMLLRGIYKQLSEERDAITLSSGEMAHAVKQFQGHLTQFEAFEKACRRYVVDSVKEELTQSVKRVAHEIAKEVANTAYEPIKQSIDALNQVSQQILEDHKQRMQEKRSLRRWAPVLLVGTALASSILGGLVVHRTAPRINESINEAMFSQIAAGRTLMRSWPNLSKTEQDKILKLGRK